MPRQCFAYYRFSVIIIILPLGKGIHIFKVLDFYCDSTSRESILKTLTCGFLSKQIIVLSCLSMGVCQVPGHLCSPPPTCVSPKFGWFWQQCFLFFFLSEIVGFDPWSSLLDLFSWIFKKILITNWRPGCLLCLSVFPWHGSLGSLMFQRPWLKIKRGMAGLY